LSKAVDATRFWICIRIFRCSSGPQLWLASGLNPASKLRVMFFAQISILRRLVLILVLLGTATLPATGQKPSDNVGTDLNHRAIWVDPGDIKSKDLFNGPGGEKHRPQLPVKFLKEDNHGHNSKFDVEDATGKKWKAKLGIEAQPETVATRLLWAIGYFANEDYFVPDLQVAGLPVHLHRGQGHVISPNHVAGVRLQRHPGNEKKAATWNWRHNPFVGTREFNGLRVMMALISNWDLKDSNNAIFQDKDEQEQYLVTDLGTAFGASGTRYTEAGSKNNLKAYRKSKFIARVTSKYISFSFPRFPPLLHIFNLPSYVHQVRMRWVGNRIPRADAEWLGGLLAQLSTEQIQDAFRAGGYSSDQAAAFTQVVQKRITELKTL